LDSLGSFARFQLIAKNTDPI